MAAKITLTLTPADGRVPRDHMHQAVALLPKIGDAPTAKVVLTVECDEDDAESYADDIDAALSNRPMGIDAVIKVVTERHIERRKMPPITPMDQIQGFAEKYGATVEFVSSDREPGR